MTRKQFNEKKDSHNKFTFNNATLKVSVLKHPVYVVCANNLTFHVNALFDRDAIPTAIRYVTSINQQHENSRKKKFRGTLVRSVCET